MLIKDPKRRYSSSVKKYFNILMDEKLLNSASVDSLKATMRLFEKNSEDLWEIKTQAPITIRIPGNPRSPKSQVISEIEIMLNIVVKISDIVVENKGGDRETKSLTQFIEYSLEIKCWSDNEKYYFREDFDPENIKSKIEACGKKRVMLRFHFDKRSQNCDPELYYHFHFGGKQGNEENFWLPSQIKEPRFPHPPMDLLLVLEFIIRNYIRSDKINEKLYKLTKDPCWREAIKISQNIFQKQYFEKCLDVINNSPDTLVGYACDYKINFEN